MKHVLILMILVLASIQMAVARDAIKYKLHANFGEMEVIGYNVSKEEFTPEYAIQWEPGTPSTQSVTVTWYLKKNREFQNHQRPVMLYVASDGVAGAGAGGVYQMIPMFDDDESWAVGEVKTWTQELSAFPLISDRETLYYYTTPSIEFYNPNSWNGEGKTPKDIVTGPARLVGQPRVYGPFMICASLPYCKMLHMF
ncbi:MAG: hypothetical protein A2X86_14930 [Bdellovibrionales bacterium GWA2_49_15]|nr:MAG: hypothetical protein A2X86_14930 [Bdellovibrionales bacterium GWA2_49_15]HAZ13363.1 hypothetical protein [Bdellovibrionales bacterium]